MRLSTVLRSCTALLIALMVALPVLAQPAASYKNGGEFYLAYRTAFAKAKSIDELLPWMAKARLSQITKTPAAERAEMFGMIKMMDDHINVKVVKETPAANGAELQVEAISGESKKKATGVITLVKEGGAWKLDQESWKGEM